MCEVDKIRYINCGIPKRIFIPNKEEEFIVAEVNIKLLEEKYRKAIIDYCVNVDSNDFDFFKNLTFQLYKITKDLDQIPIGTPRVIIVSPTVANIQSFFIYDEEVCKDIIKYIATIKTTSNLGTGTAILNNSNLRVRVF